MVTTRALKRGRALARDVALAAGALQALPDSELARQFRALAQLPDERGRVVPGFALIQEAARRALNTPHYDVQLQGGHVLLSGRLAEMRTGEGKTLTITLAAALLALADKGVHVVTANEYLAARDAQLMRPVYELLGLSVGVTLAGQSLEEKRAAYACDLTYGVGAEFGFDYLKDNLARDSTQLVQRPLYAAIVDEVDSILIDEARVPLIISDAAQDVAHMVRVVDACARKMLPAEHFLVSLKEHAADLTEAGYALAETWLSGELGGKSLYAEQNLPWVRMLHSAVKAYALYRKDRDYVVRGDELLLVDVGTGRVMEGRRLGEGLHEALEAREGLPVKQGTVTRATITYQSYFGLYPRLSGLTGTAATDAEEFSDMYGLETVVVPTNRPVVRKQAEDVVFRTRQEKFAAAVDIVRTRWMKGQPVLVGCATIRDAELMDGLLSRAGIPHSTLTAKHLDKEAAIIEQAGLPGAVTVATNMAGRGTDIHLGGVEPKMSAFDDLEAFSTAHREWVAHRDAAVAAGGLFVLGTERNGLRRVDNQLAGRCSRQGNPGEVQFLLSLEDELLRVFGGSKQVAMLDRAMATTGTALGGAVVARLVTTAQRAVESQGFGARKSLLTFDNTLADQRNAVYALRSELLAGGATEYLQGAAISAVRRWLATSIPRDAWPEAWDAGRLKTAADAELGLNLPLLRWISVEELDTEQIEAKVLELAQARLVGRDFGGDAAARDIVFDVLDVAWTEHLTALAELQTNAGLKSVAQQNAALKFPKEAFELFQAFLASVEGALARMVLSDDSLRLRQEQRDHAKRLREAEASARETVAAALQTRWVARHETCPCGSGKQFRHCHGALAA